MSQTTITAFATWNIQAGQLEKVLSLLPELLSKSREEEGNLLYEVHQSNTDANTLILYEEYTGEEALAAHRASAHFQNIVVGGIVPLLENRAVILSTRLPIG